MSVTAEDRVEAWLVGDSFSTKMHSAKDKNEKVHRTGADLPKERFEMFEFQNSWFIYHRNMF